MTFSAILRRSASIITPLAARVIGGQRFRQHTSFTLTRRGNLLSSSHPRVASAATSDSISSSAKDFSRSHFSSSSRPSSDQNLLAVVESEIKCAEETEEGDEMDEVPDNFPFQIEDSPGQQNITLTREYQGETITVDVRMPDLVNGEQNEDDDDDDEDVEGRGGNESSIPLLVSIAKKNGPLLEFACTAFPDEITIDSLSLKNPEDSEEQVAYEGPDFSDLDENLQKAFHKYLEIRGIKPSTTNFLHGYMINKDSKEYLRWLSNLKKFVEA